MIREFEFFHGPVFARMIHNSGSKVSLQIFPSPSNASYIINEKIGIYIKHSSKRMTPWRFSFNQEHQREIDEMKKTLKEVFLLLVCNDDGIVCLSYEELKQLLDDQHDPIEWISATRHKGEMYAVKGSNGELGFKIGINDFPAKVFSAGNAKGLFTWLKI